MLKQRNPIIMILIAIESTNYSDTSYIDPRRAKRHAKSLSQFPYAEKILVVSYDKNLGEKSKKILQKAFVKIQVERRQE